MNNKKSTKWTTKQIVLTALLFAIALVLSYLESQLPPVILSVQGVRLGLSNIIVMYCLFFQGKSQAYTIAILKSLFVLSTRGVSASFLSLCGGLLSLTIMVLLMLIFKDKISYLILSISGAVFHNVGQLIGVSILYSSINIFIYLPFLIVFGIAAGIITSFSLKFILPAINNIRLK